MCEYRFEKLERDLLLLQEKYKEEIKWRSFLEEWIMQTFGYNLRQEFLSQLEHDEGNFDEEEGFYKDDAIDVFISPEVSIKSEPEEDENDLLEKVLTPHIDIIQVPGPSSLSSLNSLERKRKRVKEQNMELTSFLDSNSQSIGNKGSSSNDESYEDEFILSDDSAVPKELKITKVRSQRLPNLQVHPIVVPSNLRNSGVQMKTMPKLQPCFPPPSNRQLPEKEEKRRKRKNRTFVRQRVFNNITEAQGAVKAASIWSITYTNATKDGVKVYYRCNQAKLCPAAIYLFYRNDSEVVTMFECIDPHCHRQSSAVPPQASIPTQPVSPNTKLLVRKLYEEGFQSPTQILDIFQRRSYPPISRNQLLNLLTAIRQEKSYFSEKRLFNS